LALTELLVNITSDTVQIVRFCYAVSYVP